MRKHIMILLLLLFATWLFSISFTLSDGGTIIGSLEGIKDGKMYVLVSQDKLYIIDMVIIKTINEGSGEVPINKIRTKPFMNIIPETNKYDIVEINSEKNYFKTEDAVFLEGFDQNDDKEEHKILNEQVEIRFFPQKSDQFSFNQIIYKKRSLSQRWITRYSMNLMYNNRDSDFKTDEDKKTVKSSSFLIGFELGKEWHSSKIKQTRLPSRYLDFYIGPLVAFSIHSANQDFKNKGYNGSSYTIEGGWIDDKGSVYNRSYTQVDFILAIGLDWILYRNLYLGLEGGFGYLYTDYPSVIKTKTTNYGPDDDEIANNYDVYSFIARISGIKLGIIF